MDEERGRRGRGGPRAEVGEAEPRLDLGGPRPRADLVTARPAAAPAPKARPGIVADAARTARAVVGFATRGHGARAARHLADLAASGMPAEAEDRPVEALDVGGVEPMPPRPETLPAVVSTALSRDGVRIVPDWHMVRNLPGFREAMIRTLGRNVFAQFTDTPLDEIQVLSTLSNPDRDVKAVATWILRNGIRDDDAEVDFARVMPGYAAKTQIWNVEGFTFMVVKDFGGHYVYSWPGGRGTRLDADPASVPLPRP